jgi:hypothetical protein
MIKPILAGIILLIFIGWWRPLRPGATAAILAGSFSLFFAGIGQLFLREYARGALFFVPALFLWKLADYWPQMVLANQMLFIFSAVDAFSLGKRGIGIL